MSNSSEILAILEYMEKEKQISRADMIESISSAIRNAASKGAQAGYNLKIEINPKTGALKSWALLTVTDSVADPATEIHIDKAKLYLDNPHIGDVVEREIDLSNLGRIAAKNVYQSIIQKVRQFEKDRIFDEYKGDVGNIVTGVVRRREKGTTIVDLGKAEALLPRRESVPGADYAQGERIRCLLLEIETTPRGPEIILSRASYKFVKKLFELEVSEIADGSVKIEAMAREPGYRTKIAVSSSDSRIDPVGACVGAGGSRVKSIVRELGGEKIDVIKFSPNPQTLLEECIKPAVAKNVKVGIGGSGHPRKGRAGSGKPRADIAKPHRAAGGDTRQQRHQQLRRLRGCGAFGPRRNGILGRRGRLDSRADWGIQTVIAAQYGADA